MSYICPVCNGMEGLASSCPSCSQLAEDQGKLSDFYGPYAPYRPIDDLRATNGYEDLARHQCIHLAYCPGCASSFPVSVQEQQSAALQM